MGTSHDEEIQDKLDELEGMIGLSAWEEDYLDSIREQVRSNRRLTIKQEDILNRIYTKVM